ncbi:MAG: HEPN domain-containing protein [bacterium]
MKPQTKTWLEMAQNDLDFARDVLRNKQRPFYAAHFCHQAVEKILKALVQERTSEVPPRTHNFTLLSRHAGLDLPANMSDVLLSLAPHYLGTRYPEDIQNLYRQYTEEYVKGLFDRTEVLFKWLKNVLISKK